MPRAMQFSEYGPVENLKLVERLAPEPGPGQVRLAVRAVGVNPIEWKVLHGSMREVLRLDFPAGLGNDVAGVVDAVGDGVTDLVVGDEVLGTSATPAYAEQALANASALVRKPVGVSWEVAGSLSGPGGTAVVALEKLGIGEGDTLLVHAAAGGVGVIASQLAVGRGARVIGTASVPNHDLLRSLGVEPVTYGDGLAARVRALSPDGVDAVLDASGRGELAESVELAGGNQRVLTIAGFEEAARLGVQAHFGGGGSDTPRALGELLAQIDAGRLVVPIARTYPLAEAGEALRASEAGHVRGKLVLLPG